MRFLVESFNVLTRYPESLLRPCWIIQSPQTYGYRCESWKCD